MTEAVQGSHVLVALSARGFCSSLRPPVFFKKSLERLKMRQLPNYFAVLTADVLFDKDLQPTEKLLFAIISSLSNREGYCNARNAYLGHLLNRSGDTVSSWVSSLKAKGHLEVVMIYEEDSKNIKERRLFPLSKNHHIPPLENEEGYPRILRGNNTRIHSYHPNNIKDMEESKDSPKGLLDISTKTKTETTSYVMQEWNQWCQECTLKNKPSKLMKITSARASKIKARQLEGLKIKDLLEALSKSTEWLDSWPNFSFDWCVENDTNWVKVVEGKFFNKNSPKTIKQKIEVKDPSKYKEIQQRTARV